MSRPGYQSIRVRIGFSAHFNSAFYLDYVLIECWDTEQQGGWLVDPEMMELLTVVALLIFYLLPGRQHALLEQHDIGERSDTARGWGESAGNLAHRGEIDITNNTASR